MTGRAFTAQDLADAVNQAETTLRSMSEREALFALQAFAEQGLVEPVDGGRWRVTDTGVEVSQALDGALRGTVKTQGSGGHTRPFEGAAAAVGEAVVSGSAVRCGEPERAAAAFVLSGRGAATGGGACEIGAFPSSPATTGREAA